MNLKLIKRILPIIGIAIFVYIIQDIGINKITNVLSAIPLHYIILLFFLWIPSVSVSVFIWQYILKNHKIKISILYLFKALFIADFWGVVTPGGIGSYYTIFLLKKKSGEPIEKCTSNIVLQTIIWSLTLLILALIGIVSIVQKQYYQSYLPLLIILFSILLVISITFLNKHTGKKVLQFFIKTFSPKKFKKRSYQLIEGFYKDFPPIKSIFILLLLTFIGWLVFFSTIFLLAKILLIDIPFIYFIFIYAIAVILESLPISIGGFGIREAGIIPLFAVFGVSPEKVVALCLLESIFVSWGITGALGAILHLKEEK